MAAQTEDFNDIETIETATERRKEFEKAFQNIDDLLKHCDGEKDTHDLQIIETTICRLESASKFCDQILPLLGESKDVIAEVSRNLQIFFQTWCRKREEYEHRLPTQCTHLAVYSLTVPDKILTGTPGRPKYQISADTLLNFRTVGFKWKEVSRLLLVSRWTVWRRVRELGLSEVTGFSNISNEDLDAIVSTFISIHGHLVGYSMVQGHLHQMGYHIQRHRVRASISRVDPRNARLRWATVISRRAYSVSGPNSLWHLDGHHSLINWGFVMHGAIDGYSRLICFLRCSTNNKKETVERLFLEATNQYSWPSRIRTDKGGENSSIWERMIAYRGADRGSALIGSSIHNQRIERLWRDVFRCFGNIFYYTFKCLEESGMLDTDNLLHKYILHYVFLPRINVAVDSFVNSWNSHPIRTERNWSPQQMWLNGMLDMARETTATADVRNCNTTTDNLEWYGFDGGAPQPPDDGLTTVEVDDIQIDLPEEVTLTLNQQINPLETSNVFGMDVYRRALQLVENLLANQQYESW